MSIQETEQQHYYLALAQTEKSVKDSRVCKKCTQRAYVKVYTMFMQCGLICLPRYLNFAINADTVISVTSFVKK